MCNFSWETDFKEGLHLFSFPVLQPHNELSEKKEIHAAEPFFSYYKHSFFSEVS